MEFGNYNVSTACNGEEGLNMALQLAPDLILCDIQMPKMNGLRLLQTIRENAFLKNTFFVFLTASSEKKEIQLALELGANDYIVKPFTEKELMDKLKNLLG